MAEKTTNTNKLSVLFELRRVAYYDTKKDKVYAFICDNQAIDAETTAAIYKRRWYIETFSES